VEGSALHKADFSNYSYGMGIL